MDNEYFEVLLGLFQRSFKTQKAERKRLEKLIIDIRTKLEAENEVIKTMNAELLQAAIILLPIGLRIENIFYSTNVDGSFEISLICRTTGEFEFAVYAENRKTRMEIAKLGESISEAIENDIYGLTVEVPSSSVFIEEYENEKEKNVVILLTKKQDKNG